MTPGLSSCWHCRRCSSRRCISLSNRWQQAAAVSKPQRMAASTEQPHMAGPTASARYSRSRRADIHPSLRFYGDGSSVSGNGPGTTLMEDTNGILYGLTTYGGANGTGEGDGVFYSLTLPTLLLTSYCVAIGGLSSTSQCSYLATI